jgi:Uma2 family endonuclease
MVFITPGSISELPAVDDRLATPEARFEIIDGRPVYVPPAHEPHGVAHSALDALVRAHRADGYAVAVDMLTRTSRRDDVAPDISVYPAARDPETGGRRLEELAFEIVSTESLAHAGAKAAKLAARGVRRIFAIDVERERALEWSSDAAQWAILDRRAHLDDPALAVPLPIGVLIDTARADDAVARALRARRHPEFIAEREEGRAEGLREGRAEGIREGRAEAVLAVLAARGLEPTSDELRRIRAERELARLDRWLGAARSCADVASLFAEDEQHGR